MSDIVINFSKRFLSSPYMPLAVGGVVFSVSLCSLQRYASTADANSFYHPSQSKVKRWVDHLFLAIFAGILSGVSALDIKRVGKLAPSFFKGAFLIFALIIVYALLNVLLTSYFYFRKKS